MGWGGGTSFPVPWWIFKGALSRVQLAWNCPSQSYHVQDLGFETLTTSILTGSDKQTGPSHAKPFLAAEMERMMGREDKGTGANQ